MNQQWNDKILVWSTLGIFVSLGMLVMASVLLFGLRSTYVHWGPATICIMGDGPGPSLSEAQLNGYWEGQLTLFGKVIKVYDHDPGLEAHLPFVNGVILCSALFALIICVRTHRRAYRRQFQFDL